jgi:hypothetical protein
MNTQPTRKPRLNPGSSGSLTRWLPLVLALGMVTAAWSQDTVAADELRLTFSLQLTSQVVLTGDDTCPAKLVIEGAGEASLLGPVHENASHCIRPDGSADHGLFMFTGATLSAQTGGEDSEDSISGQYVARIVPTANSVFPTMPGSPPGGYWLVYEQFCISKGTGKYAGIANDCPTSTSPGRFFPARGSVDFDTGQANIFGTALVHLTSD